MERGNGYVECTGAYGGSPDFSADVYPDHTGSMASPSGHFMLRTGYSVAGLWSDDG